MVISKKVFMVVLVFMATILWTMGVNAMQDKKEAILLVAFGTSVPEAQTVFQTVEKMARDCFQNTEIRWAYTSSTIRRKLAAQGQIIDSPETALAKLLDDGYTHVALLSLHFIPGEEFHALAKNAHLFELMAGGFDKVVVALPLLSSHEDFVRVVEAVLAHIPESRSSNDAVVLMGHGSKNHPADAIYTAVDVEFKKKDPLVFVATVEGHPTINDVIPLLKKNKVKMVYLMPFMSVAGDHAQNDMAGEEPESWKSVLERQGFTVIPILKGMAGYPEVINIWLDHLSIAMEGY